MKRFDFGEILGRAWQIIWKFKVLWIFGILAGCGRNGGGSNSRASASDGGQNNNGWYGFDNFTSNINTTELVLVILGALIFILLIIALITAIQSMGQIGLARGTVRSEEGAQTLSFGELWDTRYFRRVFMLNFVVGLVVFLLVLLFTIPVAVGFFGIFSAGENTAIPFLVALAACLLPLICVLVIAGWLASIWISLSQNAVVVENLGVRAGFRRGWQVFRENLVNTIGMGLILGILGFFINLIVSLPFFIVALPLILGIIGGSAAGAGGVIIGSVALLLVCCLAYLPVLLVVSGILNAYTGSAWTLTFMRLAGAPASAAETVLPEMPLPAGPEEPLPPAPEEPQPEASEEPLPPAL
jgi:hypothetical protein